MTDKRVTVVGMGASGASGLSNEALVAVQTADRVYGGSRQLMFFPDHPGDRRVLSVPLAGTIAELKALPEHLRVVVLASGDPLFFGIGSTLIRELGADHVAVLPHISSLQLAFARAGHSWQDAKLMSLHGRAMSGFAQRLHGVALAAVLTGGQQTPSAIARYLLRFEMREYSAFVGENLGLDRERTGWYTLDQLADEVCDPLSVLILKHSLDGHVPTFHLGMDDGAFAQRKPDRGLITKREIRVLSLSELRLQSDHVLWDIGACTGSVSIEAILSKPSLQVFAVEKNAEDLENLRQNQIAFRTDFTAIHAKAPEGLEGFPDPDAVFIGGSGGELPDLLQLCAARLRPGGRIVVNAATIETLYQAQQTLTNLGFTVSVTLVQSARSKPILQLTRFEGMNPVYLVTGLQEQAKVAVQ